MNKIRENMDRFFDRLDERWRALPVGSQHRYTLYFFTGYLLLTVGVILKVWYDTGKSNNSIVIEHIEKKPILKMKESPTLLQDTLQTILKNKIYEKK